MARNRRDPRREKVLDMRRMDGDRLSTIFDKCYPEYDWHNFPKDVVRSGMWYALAGSRKAEAEWVRKMTGGRAYRRWMMGTPPAWFRRGMNKLRRTRDKQMLIRQLVEDGDAGHPHHRRDVRWNWW